MSERTSLDKNIWHSNPTAYQIYVPSFNSHDERPHGTIKGITEKLPYLRESLGVDIIWLTPFYESPWVDGGYDVADYRKVDPKFGTMDDFRELLGVAHEKHDLKVMVDFVPNHMSTQSAWFKEASASRDNPKSDWFVFRDPKEGQYMPNNWLSEFRGRVHDPHTGKMNKYSLPAWRFVPERKQFALCTFTQEQADLNWHNPEVRQAMLGEMQFLLDVGTDGFRIDMVTYTGKHPDLLDEPLNPNYNPNRDDPNDIILRRHRNSHPSMYQYINEMAALLDKDQFMVTEDYVARDNPVQRYLDYYQNTDAQKCAPFSFENFDFMMPRQATAYKQFYDAYLEAVGTDYVPTTVLGNHDQSRIATRVGATAARAMAAMQLTLPGIAFIYNGEELGMEDVDIPLNQIQDPYDGRDPERTPMLWTPGRNAGFTKGERTWLPISPDYANKNAQVQQQDPDSFLSLYRRLLSMRRKEPALASGTYVPRDSGNDAVFSFLRSHDNEQLTSVINFGKEHVTAKVGLGVGSIALTSHPVRNNEGRRVNLDEIALRPEEAIVVRTLS